MILCRRVTIAFINIDEEKDQEVWRKYHKGEVLVCAASVEGRSPLVTFDVEGRKRIESERCSRYSRSLSELVVSHGEWNVDGRIW